MTQDNHVNPPLQPISLHTHILYQLLSLFHHKMFSSAIVSLALAASALANVFITSPVASTTFTAGQQATLKWQDDGMSPSLAQFGNATFAIYVGNAIQQTPLQTIATNVNVSSTSSIVFTPDATIGPNSNEYFIRVTSLTFMNPSQPQYPEEAFSAKFTLAGMSGQFNASVQAEINGQSTAPIGGSTAAGPSMTSMPSSAKPTSAMASVTPTTTAKSGASKSAVTTGFVGLVAAVVGASFL